MLSLYAFFDKKSGVLSNHFVTADPVEKVKQSVSISLLQYSFKDQTNPYVLFGDDYELVKVCDVPDVLTSLDKCDHFNVGELLSASRRAFNRGKDQTSLSDQLDNNEE